MGKKNLYRVCWLCLMMFVIYLYVSMSMLYWGKVGMYIGFFSEVFCIVSFVLFFSGVWWSKVKVRLWFKCDIFFCFVMYFFVFIFIIVLVNFIIIFYWGCYGVWCVVIWCERIICFIVFVVVNFVVVYGCVCMIGCCVFCCWCRWFLLWIFIYSGGYVLRDLWNFSLLVCF